MKFLNKSDQIYSVFSDDTIHIWTDENFRAVERIRPIQARENFLKNSTPQRIDLNANTNRDNDNYNVPTMNYIKDYTNGLVVDVSFSDEHMCVATKDGYLILFDTATWNLMQLIQCPDTVAVHTQFLTVSDKSGKMLISVVTVAKDTIVLDLNNLDEKLCVQANDTFKVALNENSTLMAILLRTGEIRLFDVNVLIEKLQSLYVKINADTEDGTTCQQEWNWINEKVMHDWDL